jgi:uncharacterized protein (TIGR02421 family)
MVYSEKQKLKIERENCSAISKRLIEAQRKITILDSIKWIDEIQEDFFKHKCKKLPNIDKEYYDNRPLPYDVNDKIAEFQSIIRDTINKFGNFSPFTRLISERCQEYIRALQMLEVRGTPKFSEISIELYGSPKDCFYMGGPQLIDMGTLLFDLLTVLDNQLQNDTDEKKFTAEESRDILQKRLDAFFVGSPNGVRVMVSDGIVADASAGSDTIKLREGVMFSERDLRCLEVHEGWVHVGTTLNGALQPYCDFLSKGSPSCSVLQEGLAVLSEVITFASYPSRLRKITNRVIAMNKVMDGANFVDVFNYFCSCGFTEDESYTHAARIFRGSTPDGLPFTKDLSYARGFVAAFNFIMYAMAEHQVDVIELMFIGKITIEDIPLLIELRDVGLLERPKFVPNQIRDQSGLSSWIATFLYLQRFDFAEIQKNFRFLLPAK